MTLAIHSIEEECDAATPLIRELFRVLPPAGSEFPATERAAWLIAAAALFDLLYGFNPESSITVLIAQQEGTAH
jgi:hypothetical protein